MSTIEVLLEVVALARDVCGDLDAVHEATRATLRSAEGSASWGGGVDAGAHAALLRVVPESRVLGLALTVLRP